jgi:hypothetical protein
MDTVALWARLIVKYIEQVKHYDKSTFRQNRVIPVAISKYLFAHTTDKRHTGSIESGGEEIRKGQGLSKITKRAQQF